MNLTPEALSALVTAAVKAALQGMPKAIAPAVQTVNVHHYVQDGSKTWVPLQIDPLSGGIKIKPMTTPQAPIFNANKDFDSGVYPAVESEITGS